MAKRARNSSCSVGAEFDHAGYETWQRRFGGVKDVIGQSVKLSGISYTVIGVLPQDFEFALGNDPEFWTALQPVDSCEIVTISLQSGV